MDETFEIFNRFIDRNIFGYFLQNVPEGRLTGAGLPITGQHETDDAVVIECALAGYKPSQINLEVHGNKLTISSDKVDNQESIGYRKLAKRAFKKELLYNSNDLEMSAIKASFENGVLIIEIPKKAVIKSRKIDIQIINS